MAVSLPPADDSEELDDDEPLFGAGFTTAFAWHPDEREMGKFTLIEIEILCRLA